MTFKNYLKQQGYATKTIHNMERTAFDFLCWLDKQAMEVEQVEHRDILGYIKHLQNKEVQQITIERYIGALRLFFKFKVSSATLKTNPTSAIKIQGIKRKKLYHTFTSEELHKIYNGYDPGQIKRPVGRIEKEHLLIEKRNKVILGFYVYQGIQSSELYRLEVQHIKLREGTIQVPGTKRSNTRTLPLESHQVLDIYDYVL